MAKVKSSIISEASGSLGGTAWQTVNGRIRMTQRKRPTVRDLGLGVLSGIAISSQRSFNTFGFGAYSQYWTQLSPADQQSWNRLVDQCGNLIPRIGSGPLTGKQLFMRWNYVNFPLGGGTQTTAPPAPQAPQPLDLGDQHWYLPDENGNFYVAIDLPNAIPTNGVVAFTSGPFSPGRNAIPRKNWQLASCYFEEEPNQLIVAWQNYLPIYMPQYGARSFIKLEQADPYGWFIGQQFLSCLPFPEPINRAVPHRPRF